MMQDDNIYNLAVDQATLLFNKVREKIKEQTKGIPIGMKPLTSKEQIENYLKLTPQDKLVFYQKYGHESFVRMVSESEKLIERSNKSFKRYYGIEE